MFVILDELPLESILDGTGHISSTQFPNLAALAGDSTWYRNFSSVSPTTPRRFRRCSPESSLRTSPLPTNAEHPDSLFTPFSGSYEENVSRPARGCVRGPVRRRGEQQRGEQRRAAADVARRRVGRVASPGQPHQRGRRGRLRRAPVRSIGPQHFAEFLDSLDAPDRPRLDFIHLLYPHQPWKRLPTGQRYDAPFIAEGLTGPTYVWADAVAADAGRQRHLLQARHADALRRRAHRAHAGPRDLRRLPHRDRGRPRSGLHARVTGSGRVGRRTTRVHASFLIGVPGPGRGRHRRSPGVGRGRAAHDRRSPRGGGALVDRRPVGAGRAPASKAIARSSSGDSTPSSPTTRASPTCRGPRGWSRCWPPSQPARVTTPSSASTDSGATLTWWVSACRSPTSVSTTTPGSTGRLDGAGDFDDVDPEGATVPAYVSGTIGPGRVTSPWR